MLLRHTRGVLICGIVVTAAMRCASNALWAFGIVFEWLLFVVALDQAASSVRMHLRGQLPL